MSFLLEAVVFLAAAVVTVPLFRRLGLGAVLGYLVAGVAIGPWALGLVSDVDHILHFAEFGVVLLLFVIGLELQPNRLWTLRKTIFGLGGAQLFVSAALLAVVGYGLGLGPTTAAVVGLALSLSSTAFALQMLAERNQLTTRHGRSAFSILLFQDLAAIPMLAIVPLLGPEATGPMESSGMVAGVQTVVIVLAVVIGGKFLLRPLLRMVAATRTPEVFTAMALLTVVGTALLMESVGLSMALGAFLAGVLLADSEYRHALEADIEPFKGMLLGLFFIAVGMSLNVGLVARQPGLVFALVAGLIAIKFVVLYGLGRLQGLKNAAACSLAVAISQGGEFAFVIFGVALGSGLIGPDLADLMIAVVTISMVVTPLLTFVNDAIRRRFPEKTVARDFEAPPEQDRHVIIAGFGRFGQIVGRVLRAKKIPFTALEISPEQIDFVRKYGNKVYYGDASRLALLHAARADQAAAFVLAIDDVEASLRTAETVRKHFPKLSVYARARDRKHAHQLMDLGVTIMRRETLHSSLDLAGALLTGLGLSASEAENAVETFRQHDEMLLFAHYWHHNDEEKMQALSKEGAQQLKELFEQDAAKDEAAE